MWQAQHIATPFPFIPHFYLGKGTLAGVLWLLVDQNLALTEKNCEKQRFYV